MFISYVQEDTFLPSLLIYHKCFSQTVAGQEAVCGSVSLSAPFLDYNIKRSERYVTATRYWHNQHGELVKFMMYVSI